jgi:acyl carrier protein
MKNMEAIRDKIVRVIYRAMNSVNELLPLESKLVLSMDEKLSGQDSKLDSLGYVNFITALGQEYEEEFGFSPSMTGDITTGGGDNPFWTVATLVDYLIAQYKKKIEILE